MVLAGDSSNMVAIAVRNDILLVVVAVAVAILVIDVSQAKLNR
jgi:hypothetical protein